MGFLKRALLAAFLVPCLLLAILPFISPSSQAQALALSRNDTLGDGFTFSGAWTYVASTKTWGPNYAKTKSASSKIVFWFKGRELHLIAMKGPSFGAVSVSVDGGGGGTGYEWSSTTAYQQDVLRCTVDSGEPHRVTISRASDNVPGAYIGVDAVDIGDGYVCYAPPTIMAMTLNTGTVKGGTPVIITGTNLRNLGPGTPSVTFGGIPAQCVVSDSATQIYAIAPRHEVGPVSVQVTTSSDTTPVTPACTFTYTDTAPIVNPYQQNTPAFTYVGSWNTVVTTSASAGRYTKCSTSGASVTVPFFGTRLDWIGALGTTMGYADVYLDGKLMKTINLYRSSATYRNKIWSTGPLPAAYHTVTIKRSTKSAAGKCINADRFDVLGSLVWQTRIEERNQAFGLTGAWQYFSSPNASAGRYALSNSADASATLTFSGMRFALLACTGSRYGKLRVTVDSGAPFLVDLYSSFSGFQRFVYQSPFLTPGNHVVKLEWAGVKNAASTGTAITLDCAFVVGAVDLPIITRLSPASGPRAGGNQVVISGFRLGGISAVKFGSIQAASFTADSGNQITAVAPAGTGTVQVTVNRGDVASTPDAAARYTFTP
jgi:hypothetical protein